MTFEMDHRIRALIAAGAGPTGSPAYSAFQSGDVATLRTVLDDGLTQLALLPESPGVQVEDFDVPTPDGAHILARWTTPAGPPPGSAIVFLHGGAMIAGSARLYDPLVRTYVAATGVPFLSVDYRLAPEWPAGTSALDALAALRWLHSESERFGIAPRRIGVMGDSAGGGLAAVVALLARDAGIPLAAQVLVYPMLDDRIDPDPQLEGAIAMFDYDFARTAWSAVLGTEPVPPDLAALAVPGRVADLSGVAPAFIEVGELDIFRDDDVAYATRLWRAGVSTELHVRPGLPHAFDVLLLGDELGRRSLADKARVVGRI